MRAALLLAIVCILATPTAAPAPATCADPCHLTASSTGYQMPVLVIASGTSLVVTSSDTAHVTTDGAPILATQPACFVSSNSKGVDSAPITLAIVGGVLTATVGTITKTCANASAQPDGSFVLPFYCVLHSSTMRGVLVVEP